MRTNLSLCFAGVLLAGVPMFVSCGSDDDSSRPPLYTNKLGSDVIDGGTLKSDPCTSPGRAGCPCTDTGASVDCGMIDYVSGDYVTCIMGKSTCNGEKWGACLGNRIVAQSLKGHALTPYGKRVLSRSEDCAVPCDPKCTKIVGDLTDVDAGALTFGDAGVTLTESTSTGPGSGPCTGLWCQVDACGGHAQKTSVSGTVYDPAGKVPLYNAYVYIPVSPTAALPGFTSGVTCDTCAGASNVSAVAVGQTGPDGKFQLNNVPYGDGVALVVQMGKWRRKITLPTLTKCQDNAVAPENSRLPRNRFDGDNNQADIPRMAIATGDSDPFECLLLKAGIDPAEIKVPSPTSSHRIDYYVYNGTDIVGGGAPTGTTLTGDLDTLKKYDVVLLPCEGRENAHNTQAPNVEAYTNAGGRMFTTHYGYVWLATPYPVKTPKNLTSYYGTANWKLDTWDFGDMNGTIDVTIDRSFPKGESFAQWLKNVGASTTLGLTRIKEPRHDALSAILPSQRWMYAKSSPLLTTYDMLLAMTFNTPIAAAASQQCGRVVFSDFHVSAAALAKTTPVTCNDDSACGFTSTCLPPVMGTCNTATCTTNSDCSSGYSCTGATVGSCSQQPCYQTSQCGSGRTCIGGTAGTCKTLCDGDSDCQHGWWYGSCGGQTMGACSTPSCTKKSDCGSKGTCNSFTNKCNALSCVSDADCSGTRTCSGAVQGICNNSSNAFCGTDSDCGNWGSCYGGAAGTCSAKSCWASSDCGSSGTCSGGALGSCTKACTSDADCGTSLKCVSGFCQGCYADSACPGAAYNRCVGEQGRTCSAASDRFPLACLNGDLSGQEKALEFMLFDLSACVSPDSWAPPAPSIVFSPLTFTLDFESQCGNGQLPIWREFNWKATIPTGTNIVFSAQTANSAAEYASAQMVPLATASSSTNLPNWDVAVLETSASGALYSASPRVVSLSKLRVTVTLNPSSDLKFAPTLAAWQTAYDCIDRL